MSNKGHSYTEIVLLSTTEAITNIANNSMFVNAVFSLKLKYISATGLRVPDYTRVLLFTHLCILFINGRLLDIVLQMSKILKTQGLWFYLNEGRFRIFSIDES